MKFREPAVIGISLLGILYALASWRVLVRTGSTISGDTDTVVRFAHWNLQAGIRDAYDAIIARYESMNPGVKVEQMAIPVRVWPAWQQVQLAGGTAPDIIQLGRKTNDELVSRYFLPLSAAIARPNPYNAGTSLAEVPWRNTFTDGLTGANIFYPALQETFGIPTMQTSMRVFYNADLLETVSGTRNAPTNLAEFRDLAEKVEAYAIKNKTIIMPISGSGDYGAYFAVHLQLTMTATFARTIDTQRLLRTDPEHVAASLISGNWNLDTPGVAESLQVYQMMGRWMQPGFLQLRREDATLHFSQGHALAMVTGSWDYYLLEDECPFPLIIGPLPIPDANDPEFPASAATQRNELDRQPNGIFGVAQNSNNPDAAIDFLRFLTSQSASKEFGARSKTLAAVVGVEPVDEAIGVFMPYPTGPVGGFQITFGAASNSWFQQNIHRLFAPGVTVTSFAREQSDPYREAILDDLRRNFYNQRHTSERGDTILTAALQLEDANSPRLNALIEAQVVREQDALQLEWIVRTRTTKRLPKK